VGEGFFMRVALLVAGTLALLANLLMPQQLVRYNACCKPQADKPVSMCCGMNSASDAKGSLRVHRNCCDPIKITLRSGPASVATSTEVCEATTLTGIALPATREVAVPPEWSLVRHSAPATGPPQPAAALYQLHAQYLV
jgi:hypothetical protein